jgi:YD repeat-containing protein
MQNKSKGKVNTLKFSLFTLTLFLVQVLSGQTTASLSINTQVQGNRIARDQIKLSPPGGQVIYNVSNGNGHLFLDRTLQLPSTYLGSAPTIVTKRLIDKNLKPGSIKGSHKVDLSGAFNYNIPIQIPPGTNEMAPIIGLSYNSSMGSQFMGVGWGISGLSVISRIPKDLFHDGTRSGIEFTLAGPFALDGNRLSYQGVNGNGENFYFTESETFSKITLKNQTTQNPYFEVIAKNGLTMIYGNTPDSRGAMPFAGNSLPLCGGTLNWYLTKIIDNYGNYIEYNYYNSLSSTIGSEVAIKEIKYTGNANAGINPYNSIKFYYDLRSDQQRLYFNGDMIDRKLLLREIAIYNEISSTIPVANYKFVYSKNDLTYLNEIEYSGMNHEKLNSSVFIYGSNKPAMHFTNQSNTPTSLPLNADYTTTDLNGDGKSDLIAFLYNPSSVNSNTGFKSYDQWQVYLNNGNGFTSTSPNQSISESPAFTPFTSFGNTMLGITPVKLGFLLADVLGDDGAEVIYSKDNNGLYSDLKAYSFDANSGQMLALPLSLSSFPSGYTVKTANLSANEEVSVALGDFDGNGKSELIHFWKDNIGDFNLKYINFQNNTIIFRSTNVSPALSVLDINNNYQPLTSYSKFTAYDFDKDGKSELVGLKNIGSGDQLVAIKVSVSVSGSNITLQEVVSQGSILLDHSYFGDYNGDGYADFIRHGVSSLSLIEGLGNGLNASSAIGGNTISGHGKYIYRKMLPLDINADGKTDLVELINNSGLELNVCYGGQLQNGFINLGTIQSMYLPHIGDDEINATGDRDYDGQSGLLGDAYSTTPLTIPMFSTGDFNGDGYPDLLMKGLLGGGGSDIIIIYFNFESDEKYLTNVYDGYDNDLEITYSTLPILSGSNYIKSTSNLPHTDLSNFTIPLTVTKQIINNNNGKGIEEIFEYQHLFIHTKGRGLLGFDKVVKKYYHPITFETTKITEEFDLNLTYFVRKPKAILTEFMAPSGNKTISNTNFVSNIYGYNSGINSRYFSEIIAKTTLDYYLNSTTNTSYLYDYNNGNLLSEITNIGPGKKITQISYSNFVTAGSWISNAPQNRVLTISRAGEATFTRNTALTYDLSKGSLLSVTEEPSDLKSVCITKNYDQITGVLKKITETAPNDNSTPPPSPKVIDYDYDSKSRFIEKTTFALGYVFESKYEHIYGNLVLSKDLNDIVTKYSYDNFGELIETQDSDGSKILHFSYWYNSSFSNLNDPLQVNSSTAMFMKRVEYPDGKIEISYYDRYNRILKTETNIFDNKKVSNLINYNSKGEISQQFGPYQIPLPSGKSILETNNTYSPDLGLLVTQQVNDGNV